MLCMKKGKDARHAAHEPTNAQMLYLFLARIASKYPQATAEPSALFLAFSPSPVRPLGED